MRSADGIVDHDAPHCDISRRQGEFHPARGVGGIICAVVADAFPGTFGGAMPSCAQAAGAVNATDPSGI